jgi:hypothetical protein
MIKSMIMRCAGHIAWERWKMHVEFLCKRVKRRGSLEEIVIEGRMMIKLS